MNKNKENIKSLIYKRFEECEIISQFRQDVFDLIDRLFEEQEKKYYFFVIQGTNKQGSKSSWNYVSDKNPIQKLLEIEEVENLGSKTYYNFIITYSFEITKEEFELYKNKFEN